ncbi:glucosamine 6-phosphate N-acetyltransferase isoform X1 [Hydra vulgaris]|uniref:Glucosamine 6-phosphate N-acetyltransferase n=1 Tax=Hydra vulgaris TaxID=6087 RepID=T2M7Y7_HYDVU|nr:glucosamine 6-phosphate N-acetyltransferase [Hydra vulgaris]XP_047128261.1 glucosamine 6-phosphate N-acetyltransferase [Hydra vulgaris]
MANIDYMADADYIFDKRLLERLDYSKSITTVNHNISYTYPGKDLVLRPLLCSDYEKGYMDLLSQLTQPGIVTKKMFKERFDSMKKMKDVYLIVVVEDIQMQKVVGSATLFIENILTSQFKPIKIGRIEDVVIHDSQRGKYLGKLLCETLVLLGKQLKCVEITLECKDNLVKFYRSLGFELDKMHKYMTLRYT